MTAARALATRGAAKAGMGAVGQQASGFGASALAASATSKSQQHGQAAAAPAPTVSAQQPQHLPTPASQPDYGATGWVRKNPGEAAVAAGYAAMTARSMAEHNTPVTQAILQRAQFG